MPHLPNTGLWYGHILAYFFDNLQAGYIFYLGWAYMSCLAKYFSLNCLIKFCLRELNLDWCTKMMRRSFYLIWFGTLIFYNLFMLPYFCCYLDLCSILTYFGMMTFFCRWKWRYFFQSNFSPLTPKQWKLWSYTKAMEKEPQPQYNKSCQKSQSLLYPETCFVTTIEKVNTI